MKPSALQLRNYIVTELSVSANRTFDPDKKVQLGLPDVTVESECVADKKDGRAWQIVLRIKQAQSAESNSPYFFMIEMAGFFMVSKAVSDERVAEFVEVNGASVLYSTAREVLRSTMAMGPYLPILLPAGCFFDPQPKNEDKKAVETSGVKTKEAVQKKARGAKG